MSALEMLALADRLDAARKRARDGVALDGAIEEITRQIRVEAKRDLLSLDRWVDEQDPLGAHWERVEVGQ